MGYEIFELSFRVFFLAMLPLLAVTSLASVLIVALQTVTSINEPAIGYSVRLLALIFSLYMVLPETIESLVEIMYLVLQ